MAKFLDHSGLSYLWGKLKALFAGKQDTLVSGTNIKTVNGNSILGSGNISQADLAPEEFEVTCDQLAAILAFATTHSLTLTLSKTYAEIVTAATAGKKIMLALRYMQNGTVAMSITLELHPVLINSQGTEYLGFQSDVTYIPALLQNEPLYMSVQCLDATNFIAQTTANAPVAPVGNADYQGIPADAYMTYNEIHGAVSGMATQTWVQHQGYLNSDDISDMATETWVNQQGFAFSADIPDTSDMATETWVKNQNYAEGNSTGAAQRTAAIPYGECDITSTSTAFTATVPGITELTDGVCVLLKNGVVTSAAASEDPKCFTLNINGLGAMPVYNSMTAASFETTKFNTAYTMLFVYDSTRKASTAPTAGGWVLYNGYDSNTNTIGYQLRTNSMSLPMASVTYRYRLLFTSADGTRFVPANNSTSTNATAKRDTIQTKIDPFGRMVYYGTTASVAAGSRPSAAYLWSQYVITLGYSFNRTGAALTLTSWKPVYIKCAPQSDGSAIIDADTPYVQDLPSTDDGKIYIMLGVANAATTVEMFAEHPVYYFKAGAIRLWTNQQALIDAKQDALTFDSTPTSSSTNPVTSGGVYSALSGKQATLVSGTSIKTVNGQTLLGSGDISADNTPTSGSTNLITSGAVYSAIDAAINGAIAASY